MSLSISNDYISNTDFMSRLFNNKKNNNEDFALKSDENVVNSKKTIDETSETTENVSRLEYPKANPSVLLFSEADNSSEIENTTVIETETSQVVSATTESEETEEVENELPFYMPGDPRAEEEGALTYHYTEGYLLPNVNWEKMKELEEETKKYLDSIGEKIKGENTTLSYSNSVIKRIIDKFKESTGESTTAYEDVTSLSAETIKNRLDELDRKTKEAWSPKYTDSEFSELISKEFRNAMADLGLETDDETYYNLPQDPELLKKVEDRFSQRIVEDMGIGFKYPEEHFTKFVDIGNGLEIPEKYFTRIDDRAVKIN